MWVRRNCDLCLSCMEPAGFRFAVYKWFRQWSVEQLLWNKSYWAFSANASMSYSRTVKPLRLALLKILCNISYDLELNIHSKQVMHIRFYWLWAVFSSVVLTFSFVLFCFRWYACLSFFLLWGGTRSLRMPALRPASQAGPMRNPIEGTSAVLRDTIRLTWWCVQYVVVARPLFIEKCVELREGSGVERPCGMIYLPCSAYNHCFSYG